MRYSRRIFHRSGRLEARRWIVPRDAGAVLELHEVRIADALLAAGRRSGHGERLPRYQRIVGPAATPHARPPGQFATPVGDLPGIIGHVEVHVGMRIHQPELGDDALDRDGIVHVEMRRGGMMRVSARCDCKQEDSETNSIHDLL
ncbi:MAG: hypothetical protein F4181_14260 [Proteobacteria bacterium]|nr:hypothetical protein [Pseudomonadota bacterium]